MTRRPAAGGRVARARSVAALAAVLVLAASGPARAHEFRPALLVIEVDAAGAVEAWIDAGREPGADVVGFSLPAQCVTIAAEGSRVRATCGAAGRSGVVTIRGLVTEPLVVRLRRPEGEETRVLRPGATALPLGPEDAPPGFFALGLRHIAAGADHLLFVAGLALLVRPALRLAAALTAFTAAHAVTLALAAFGALRLPQAPVEACIALSLVLLARALARGERPSAGAAWRLAGACGLVHGLGFAGALAEVGLPPDAAVAALLAFHAGVELGQIAAALAVVGLAGAAARAWPRAGARARVAVAYALGAVAAAWTLGRVLACLDPRGVS